jgi:hypothetical protein
MNSDKDKELSTYFYLTKKHSMDDEMSQPILNYEPVTQYYNPSPPKILQNEESIFSPELLIQYNNPDFLQSLPTVPPYLNINQTQYPSSVIKQSYITSQPATIPKQISTLQPVIRQTTQPTVAKVSTLQPTTKVPTMQVSTTKVPTIQVPTVAKLFLRKVATRSAGF